MENKKKPKILIGVIRAGSKTYCFDFFPKFAQKIKYENSDILLVDELECPLLKTITDGAMICTKGRQHIIEYARKRDYDFIYFLDLDLEVESDILDKLVSLEYPLVGSLVAGRGVPYKIIGHNYVDREKYERVDLYYPDLKTGDSVDAIGGCSLLVHKTLYNAVDFTGMEKPEYPEGRYCMDDEYLQIKIYNKFGIQPKIYKETNAWHYSEDGYKYQLLGKKERYI